MVGPKSGKKRLSAKEDAFYYYAAGDASKVVSHFNVNPGDAVVAYCRVTTQEQERNGNLISQVHLMERLLCETGVEVVGIIAAVGHGKDMPKLNDAVRLAKSTNAKIASFSVDRLIRNRNFRTGKGPVFAKIRASNNDLNRLHVALDGIEATTWMKPNSTLRTVNAERGKLGQELSGNTGGRPEKDTKFDREQDRKNAVQMFVAGYSKRTIAKFLSRPEPTVRRWINKSGVPTPVISNREKSRMKKQKRVSELRTAGFSINKIAHDVGVSNESIYRWIRESTVQL